MRSNDRDQKFLNDLAKVARGAMRSMGDIKGQIKTMVGGFLSEMDIVTREEFERVEALAQKARERQAELEKRLAVLEKRMKPGKKK
ncbi:MAG: accessory factor UbiK family protein [Pseudomonadota bacterium]